MFRTFLDRIPHLGLVFILFLLAACATSPNPGIDVSQLLRVKPEKLLMILDVPPGLGTTGKAGIIWGMRENGEEEPELVKFELRQISEKAVGTEGARQVNFALKKSDYKTFERQQILLRAHLLAGTGNLNILAGAELCNTLGVPIKGRSANGIIVDTETGLRVLSFANSAALSQIKATAPACL
ncbi:MAG: hypothetical protein ACPGNV_12750 [Mangrovicoccus sp.]